MLYDVVAHASIRNIDRLNRITSNIANVNTPGYKADDLSFVRKDSAGPMQNNAFSHYQILTVDFSPGVVQRTGNVLDLAIHGDGFFVVESKGGDISVKEEEGLYVAKSKGGEYYTRSGSFTLNGNGELVTQSGDYVMGEGGRIVIEGDDMKGLQISNGGIIEVDGDEVGRLRIVSFKNRESLGRIGEGLFKDSGGAGLAEEENPEISSGYLELSNVNVIKEMVEMINVQRSFEAYQKAMHAISEQDKLAINRVGKLL